MTDALERLKQRKRPTVPSRDTSLGPAPGSASGLKVAIPRHPGIENPDAVVPSAAPPVLPLETKQTTLRLEKGLSDRLQDFCRTQGICREVWLEALFEYCEAHPDILPEVLAAATTKNNQRQQLANQKRAHSMMQRFGQPH